MDNQYIYPIQFTSANFAEALAPDEATPINSLSGLPFVRGRQYWIRAIAVSSKQNIGPAFQFFGSAAGHTTDVDTDQQLGLYGFPDVLGEQIDGTGLYRYYVCGLAIPYYDADSRGQASAQPLLHVSLVNRSLTSKNAGTTGALSGTVWVEMANRFQQT